MKAALNANLLIILGLVLLFTPAASAKPPLLKIITGNVFDVANGNPLPYTNIYVLGTAHGTVANIEGSFRLDLTAIDLTLTDTLVVSQIGYRPITLPLLNFDYTKPLKVGLHEQPTTLRQVEVVGLTPLQLLKKAAKATNDNSFSPVILHSYSRVFECKSGHYTKFADAAIDYYVKNENDNWQVEMKLIESRVKSKPFKIDSGLNDVDFPFPINTKKFASASNLVWLINGLFAHPDRYDFDVEEQNGKDGGYTIVKFKPKPGIKKPLCEGSIAISNASFLVQYVDYQIAEENKKFTKIHRGPFWRERITSTRVYLKFGSLGEHSYLLYARLEGAIKLYDGRKTDVTNQFANEMLVTSVSFKDISPFTYKERYHKSNIFKSGNHYTSKFWEGKRGILATRDEERIIESLDEEQEKK